MEALLGEGMPWRITMIFFALGAWYGLKGERKSRFEAQNAADTEGVAEILNEANTVEKEAQVLKHY